MSAILKRVLESILWMLLGVLLHWLWTVNGGGDIVEIFKKGLLIDEEESSTLPAGTNLRMNATTHSVTSSSMVIGTKQQREKPELKEEEKELVVQHDNNNNNSHHQPLPFRFNSSVKIIFVMGLEGTGHHLVSSLVSSSPGMKQIQKLGVHKTGAWLHQWLFNAQGGDGLWDAHCCGHDVDTIRKAGNIQQKVVAIPHILERHNATKPSKYYFLNTIDPFSSFGMVSYPNFASDCRFLDYPNLDLWYHGICDMANVDCEHVYIYRDPIRILQSTFWKRDFNPTLLYAIQLYMTMYHIIASQIEEETQYYANRTIGCYGFYENTTDSWLEGIRQLTGWENTPEKRQEYHDFIDKIYQPPPPLSSAGNTSWVIPDDLDMYMKPLNDLHERVKRICQNSLEKRRNMDIGI